MQQAYSRWARMILACGLVSAGCAQQSRVALVQPQLSGLQRNIQLCSRQGYWADDGRTRRLLIEFPLPGAATGRPNYLLYLRVPSALMTQPADVPAGDVISGFLIQTRGENAGVAILQTGRVRLLPRHLNNPEEFAVELNFDDGSQVGGLLVAQRSEHHLRLFETEQRTADVEAAIRRQSHK